MNVINVSLHLVQLPRAKSSFSLIVVHGHYDLTISQIINECTTFCRQLISVNFNKYIFVMFHIIILILKSGVTVVRDVQKFKNSPG